MPGYKRPVTNEDILRRLREDREKSHRRYCEWRFIHRYLVLPLTLPLPDITLDHIQDSCNKSIPIYCTGPKSGSVTATFNLVFQQWFCGHKTDLEFGRFPAKLIRIESPEMERGTVQDIFKVHNALCEQADAKMPSFYDDEVTAVDFKDRPERGFFGINGEQHMHFKIQPLFCTLFIVIDELVKNPTEQIVHLVSTGILPSGLSEPVSLEGFEDARTRGEIRGRDVVTTTLPAAIEFVIKLEEREQRACLDVGDLTVLDNALGGTVNINKIVRRQGFTGEEIKGPSTNWVSVSEGEAIVPPRTALSEGDRI